MQFYFCIPFPEGIFHLGSVREAEYQIEKRVAVETCCNKNELQNISDVSVNVYIQRE